MLLDICTYYRIPIVGFLGGLYGVLMMQHTLCITTSFEEFLIYRRSCFRRVSLYFQAILQSNILFYVISFYLWASTLTKRSWHVMKQICDSIQVFVTEHERVVQICNNTEKINWQKKQHMCCKNILNKKRNAIILKCVLSL